MFYLNTSTQLLHTIPEHQQAFRISHAPPPGLYVLSEHQGDILLQHYGHTQQQPLKLSDNSVRLISTLLRRMPQTFCYVSPYPYITPSHLDCSQFDQTRILYAQPDRQTLSLITPNALHARYPMATAKNGLGQVEGTETTPTGLHCITEYIGQDATAETYFVGRVAQGDYRTAQQAKEHILARILRMDGMELGWNHGHNHLDQNVDSRQRYIYIHGTPEDYFQPEPSSHGCLRMRPDDIIRLFDSVYPKPLALVIADAAQSGNGHTLDTSQGTPIRPRPSDAQGE